MARTLQATVLILALAPVAGCDTSRPLLESWGVIDGAGRTPAAVAEATPAALPEKPAAAAIEHVTAPAAPPSPAAPVTLAAVPQLPTTLPPDAVRLTGPEIRAAFADMHERYTAIDMAGFMSAGAWLDETMSVTWMKDSGISGHLAGAWRVEDDRLCIDYRSGYRAPETECLAFYRHGAGYLSVNPDGSLHGYHELTPR